MALWRYDYLLNASELTFYISTGMEDYNIMIEYWGSATSEYPFSLPSGVPPLIIKLFSWKSSLFLNYLGRWSGNWIFCGGQSFLRAKKKEGETNKKVRKLHKLNKRAKKIHIQYMWPYRCLTQGKQSRSSNITTEHWWGYNSSFPFSPHIYKKQQHENPVLLNNLKTFTHI